MFKSRFGWISALCCIAGCALLSRAATPTYAIGLPPVAIADEYVTDANQPLIVNIPGLLLNDQHPEGAAFWVNAYMPARSGVLSDFYADGRFTYTPNLNFVGVDVFYYQLKDVHDATSASFATVSIFVGVKAGDDVLNNGSFEAPDLSSLRSPEGWTVQNANGDQRACNQPGGMIAQDQSCAFRFKGSPKENAQIKQIIDPALTEGLADGDTLALTFYARTDAADRRAQVTLKITYTDTTLGNNGVSNHVLKLPKGTTMWWFYTTQPITLEGEVSEVMVRVIHKGLQKSGKVWLDNIRVVEDGHVVLTAAPLAPLDGMFAVPRAPLPAWTATTPVQPVTVDDALQGRALHKRSDRLIAVPDASRASPVTR